MLVISGVGWVGEEVVSVGCGWIKKECFLRSHIMVALFQVDISCEA